MPDDTRQLVFRIRVTAPIDLDAEEMAGLLEAMLDMGDGVGYADAAESCDEPFELAELARLATRLDMGPFELEAG